LCCHLFRLPRFSPGRGAEKSEVVKAPSENQRLQQDIKSIRRGRSSQGGECALKKQNQLLQSENQRLRRLLGNTSSATNADSGAEGESSTARTNSGCVKDATTNQSAARSYGVDALAQHGRWPASQQSLSLLQNHAGTSVRADEGRSAHFARLSGFDLLRLFYSRFDVACHSYKNAVYCDYEEN